MLGTTLVSNSPGLRISLNERERERERECFRLKSLLSKTEMEPDGNREKNSRTNR